MYLGNIPDGLKKRGEIVTADTTGLFSIYTLFYTYVSLLLRAGKRLTVMMNLSVAFICFSFFLFSCLVLFCFVKHFFSVRMGQNSNLNP